MVTIDTNIAFYALAKGPKAQAAKSKLAVSDFLSAQVLNEFANAMRRKLHRSWQDIGEDIAILRDAVPRVVPIEESSNRDALRLAERYQLNFYDAVLVAVALANQATVLYSEDMHHAVVIDDRLTIINPYRESA